MSYKEANISDPGTSIKHGADDTDKIAKLLNGKTVGVPPIIIKVDASFDSDHLIIQDDTDNTKKAEFRLHADHPVSTTRNYTLPAEGGNILNESQIIGLILALGG